MINGNFGTTVKISIAIISVILMVLFFVLGGQTAQKGVIINTQNVGINKVKIEQNKENIKEGFADLKIELREQRTMIHEIHRILIEDR